MSKKKQGQNKSEKERGKQRARVVSSRGGNKI
jgi:hypothetical protein